MRELRKYHLLLLLILLVSCRKEEEEPVEVFLRAEGFRLESSGQMDIPGIEHEFAGGIVHFDDGSKVRSFVSWEEGFEHTPFALPPGKYRLEVDIPLASLYGQKGASFNVLSTDVEVKRESDTLAVEVEANCAMMLVYDPESHLDDGPYMIERHSYNDGYFISYPMSAGPAQAYYYSYFTPDTVPHDPSAFVWFYAGSPGKEEGGLPTKDMEAGMIYLVEILE